MPLALIHAATGEAESQAHLREAANQLAIPIEKHIVWSKSESISAGPLNEIFGVQGESKDGMVKFTIGRPAKMHGVKSTRKWA